MDSEMEGKAKVNYNGQAPAKTLKMSFVPTTVEWTEDSLKKNQATIPVEVTPNRKFEGIFGWDFQALSTGNFRFDVKRENPWVGNYAIDRHANWEMNKPRYMFNWVGKSEFKTGPFSSFSPIDTKMNIVFNTRKMVLNA